MDKSITVLLSTYNGEKYLTEQIDSLMIQKGVDLHVLIRDDGSTDATIKIIQNYCNRDERVHFIQGSNVGAGQSFFDLIRRSSDTEFYAFCDQDDVWDADKLFCALKMIGDCDTDIPVLYHSNLRIVDEQLGMIRNAHENPIDESLKYSCLARNAVTGWTSVFNLAAKKMIQEHIPTENILHDGWIYMVCKIFGKVYYDFKPHISYRQHAGNVVGMHKTTLSGYLSRIRRFVVKQQQPRYERALLFQKYYWEFMMEEDQQKLLEILEYKKSLRNRLRLLFDTDIREQTPKGDLRYRILIIRGGI